jgi:hypothetical protein
LLAQVNEQLEQRISHTQPETERNSNIYNTHAHYKSETLERKMHIESKPPPRVHYNNKRPRPVLRQPRLAAASAEVSAARRSVRTPRHTILPSTCISANKQVAQMKIIKSHRHAPVRKINISCEPRDFQLRSQESDMRDDEIQYMQLRGAGAGPMHSRLDSSRPPVCHSNFRPIRNAFAER